MKMTGKGEGTVRASLELLYNVSREFAGDLDLRTVLQRVLFLSMKTVGATTGSIIVLDDNSKPIESTIIAGSHVENHTTQRLRITIERGLAGWVARTRQGVLINDTSQDERWIARKYDSGEEGGPKSAVSAPLLVKEKLVGVITLAHFSPGFFSQDHLELMQAIADQAGIAVLNARLYEESQRQARVMTALAESAAAITASLNQEEVLVRILEQISQALRVQAVSLALIDSQKEELVFRAAIGWIRKNNLSSRIPVGQGIAGWVAREERGVIVPDVQEDSRYDPEVNRRTGIMATAMACAPIRARGQVVGVLEALNPQDNDFDPDALLVLTGIGSLAGSAIRHAQLFEEIQTAHQRYRDLFEGSIDPILITDWEGKIVEANRQAASTTEIGREILLEMTIRQVHELNEAKAGAHFEQLGEGETISYESKMLTRSGKAIPVQVYGRQVHIEGIPHIQWILRDITEKKNLDSLRDDLLAMIYHDLQSPLANVISALDVLGSMLPKDEDGSLQSLLGIANRSTMRIQRLTSSLLDIRRLEAGQPVGNRAPVSPVELAQDAADTVAATSQTKRQQVNNLVSADLPPVLVDADMIHRVLANLMENAVKYTPQEGSISIGARQEDDWLQMWVQDNGPGIPESDQQRIFEKFTRLSSRDAPRGIGLGLAYCRLAVEGHGGRIWVESQPGAGSRFTFTLPLFKSTS